MNVLLVDPSIGTGDGLNTGLGWLAASVEAAGHGARVLDLVNRPQNFSDGGFGILREAAKSLKPDFVGFCVHSNTEAMVTMLASRFKSECGLTIPILLGGPQMAFTKGAVLDKIPAADFVFVGEAEDSLPEFLSLFRSGVRSFGQVNGLAWRDKEGTIVENPPRELRKDISGLPFPDYKHHFGLTRMSAHYSLMTSRGCPFKCIFCNTFMSGKLWRTRPLENVIEELKYAIENYGIREFMVQEPVFNLKPERVVEFCKMLRREGLALPWFSPSGIRADRITPEMLEAMKASNCQEVKIGVESLVPDVFNSVNKGVSLEKLQESCRIIKSSGFPLRGSFIIGLPGDTYEKALENYRLSVKLGFETTDWSLLIPYPGTKVYDWVKACGIEHYTYQDANQISSEVKRESDVKVAFETKEFTAAERARAFVKIAVKSGNYIFDRSSGKWRISLSLLSQILRHDPLRLPHHLMIIRRKYAKSLQRGPSKVERYVFSPLPPPFRVQK